MVEKTELYINSIRKFYGLSMLLLLALIMPGSVYADKSQWELGIGLSVLDIPFYPGSSERKTYVVPIPHVLYR